MTRALRFTREHIPVLVGITLIVVLLAGQFGGGAVSAHHEPANKFAAAGSATDDVEPNTDHIVLSETLKVSTPFDLALSATAECSILTYLNTEGSGPGTGAAATNTASAEGIVEMWVEIDGEPVPVQTGDIDPEEDGVQNDDGEVTFCNRKYERTVTDAENPLDGIDSERDFIRTRTANGFNWFALDVGANYDKPDVPAGSGNNIVQVDLVARYTDSDTPCQEVTNLAAQDDCSVAFVGKRTLIAEPTNASVHEAVLPAPGAGN